MTFAEVENKDPGQHQRWLDKHGFKPDAAGAFPIDRFEGKVAVGAEKMLENIRINVSNGWYEPLYDHPYDERTFVMCCGGPSLGEHLVEIGQKAAQPERYLVVCSNMTGAYLREHGIVPHVQFILDPQEKKRRDVENASSEVQYWINVACDPAVFRTLQEQGIKPYGYLADFDAEGKAIKAVRESMLPGQGMMAIQGGSMAGLRAINLADAKGFRKMEFYGFDATARIHGERAQLYAYDKKRGEAIIEVQCDRCPARFDTTLILQLQVNEFLTWRMNMPWMDMQIIGGGLIAHSLGHAREAEARHPSAKYRYTKAYKHLQKELHDGGDYGHAGQQFIPTIFHAVAQLAKRHGAVSVLDYGSASGNTMKKVREHLWLPPNVEDRCYDPFVEQFAAEPEPADFVICTDVLEHVEPQCIHAVLDHIQALTRRIAFFSISLVLAKKTLSDGRNAHINLPGVEFWLKEMKRRFVVSEAKVTTEYVLVIAQAIEDVKETLRGRNGA
ncbi:MAG: DUF115 domain-containing protein [Armatimonadetes bacterium]|nr:DUF115 domain-containing protein [Armatimonadota bacterium]